MNGLLLDTRRIFIANQWEHGVVVKLQNKEVVEKFLLTMMIQKGLKNSCIWVQILGAICIRETIVKGLYILFEFKGKL